MAGEAVYDEIADWYEKEFLGAPPLDPAEPTADPIGIYAALDQLVKGRTGACVEIGCGTGFYASWLRRRGLEPIGLDVSTAMLRYAKPRLPVLMADARQLPLASGSVSTVLGIMVHTDMPDYPSVLGEVARVLDNDGVFVHVGVHPCFCGGFADRADPEAVVIRPGYRDGHWTKASYTEKSESVLHTFRCQTSSMRSSTPACCSKRSSRAGSQRQPSSPSGRASVPSERSRMREPTRRGQRRTALRARR